MKCDSYVVGTYKIEEVLKADNHCDIVKFYNVYKDVSKDAHCKPEWDLVGRNFINRDDAIKFIRHRENE